MVIDTSAIIAILLSKDEALDIIRTITMDSMRLISSFTALESSVVISARKGVEGGRELELLMYKNEADIVPFSQDQYVLAHEA